MQLLLITLITSFISGVFGMAGGILLMGFLLYFLPVGTSMVLHGYIQFISNFNRSLQIRQHIYWKSMLPFLLGLATAIALFTGLSIQLEKKYVYYLLGILPLFGFLPRSLAFDFAKKPHAYLCGFSSLSMQLMSGVNGPLLDVFFIRTNLSRHQIVATKAFTQSISHVLKVLYFILLGGVGLSDITVLPVWFYIACIPVSIIGTYMGIKVLNRMSDKSFLAYTRWILLIIGCYYLYQGYLL